MEQLTFLDESVAKVLKRLIEEVDKSFFKDKVYIIGDSLIYAMLGKTFTTLRILVDLEKGAEAFTNWVALKFNCMEMGENPLHDNDFDLSFVYVDDVLLDVVSTDPMKKSTRSSLKEALKDCSFSFEGLAYNITTHEICDPMGVGYDDFTKHRIRAIGDVDLLMEKNQRAIFSAIKYANNFEFGVSKDLWMCIVKNAHRVSDLNKAILRSELLNIITSDKPSNAIRKMANCGLMRYIFPSIDFEADNDEAVFGDAMKCLDAAEPIGSSRFAALFHNIGSLSLDKSQKPQIKASELARKELTNLGFAGTMVESVVTAIKNYKYFDNLSENIPERKVKRFNVFVLPFFIML